MQEKENLSNALDDLESILNQRVSENLTEIIKQVNENLNAILHSTIQISEQLERGIQSDIYGIKYLLSNSTRKEDFAPKITVTNKPQQEYSITPQRVDQQKYRLKITNENIEPEVIEQKIKTEHEWEPKVSKVESVGILKEIHNTKEIYISRKITKRRRSQNTSTLQCQICDRLDFKSKKRLQLHMRDEHNIKMFVCPKCGVRFKHNNYLKSHMKCKHGEGLERKCRFCEKPFRYAFSLKGHEARCKYKQSCTFSCAKCAKAFPSEARLSEHSKEKHNLHCEHCVKVFSSSRRLQYHVNRAHQPKKRKLNV